LHDDWLESRNVGKPGTNGVAERLVRLRIYDRSAAYDASGRVYGPCRLGGTLHTSIPQLDRVPGLSCGNLSQPSLLLLAAKIDGGVRWILHAPIARALHRR
jgi:hypothetical protein